MQVTKLELVAAVRVSQSRIEYAVARRLAKAGNRFSVEDVMQEAAIRCMRSLESKDLDFASEDDLIAWISCIAGNVSRSMVRDTVGVAKRSLLRESCAIGVGASGDTEGYQPVSNTVDPALAAEVADECAKMMSDLDTLPAKYQAAIRMRFMDDMGNAEIADKMGLTVDAVKGMVKRGLQMMRSSAVAV